MEDGVDADSIALALSDLFAPMKRLPGSVANHKTWPSLPGPKRTYSSSLIMPIRSS